MTPKSHDQEALHTHKQRQYFEKATTMAMPVRDSGRDGGDNNDPVPTLFHKHRDALATVASNSLVPESESQSIRRTDRSPGYNNPGCNTGRANNRPANSDCHRRGNSRFHRRGSSGCHRRGSFHRSDDKFRDYRDKFHPPGPKQLRLLLVE